MIYAERGLFNESHLFVAILAFAIGEIAQKRMRKATFCSPRRDLFFCVSYRDTLPDRPRVSPDRGR